MKPGGRYTQPTRIQRNANFDRSRRSEYRRANNKLAPRGENCQHPLAKKKVAIWNSVELAKLKPASAMAWMD
jgi:hypothetical protein